MELIQSKPEFSIQCTEPFLILSPGPIEINCSIESILKYQPTATFKVLVTKHLNRCFQATRNVQSMYAGFSRTHFTA